MSKYWRYLVFMLVVSGIVAAAIISGHGNIAYSDRNTEDIARAGRLDLSGWDLTTSQVAVLKGNWKFRYGALADPRQMQKMDLTGWGIPFAMPAVWNGHDWQGSPLPGQGQATFAVDIAIPVDHRRFTLDFRYVTSAAEIWVDGQLLHRAGELGTSLETEVPRKRFGPVDIPVELTRDGNIRLVVLVSNYNHFEGGFFGAIELGLSSVIDREHRMTDTISTAAIGAFVFVLVYGLLVLPSHNGGQLALPFFIYIMAVLGRTLCTSEFIYKIFPEISDLLVDRIEYGATMPFIVTYLYIFRFLFPNDISRLHLRLLTVFAVVWTAVILVTEPVFFTQLRDPSMLVLIVLLIYLVTRLCKALWNRRPGAQVIGMSFVVMLPMIVHDVLIYSNLIDGVDIAYLSFGILLIGHGVVISDRVNAAFSDVQSLSEELQQVNRGLEDQVNRRTAELQEKTAVLETTMESMDSGLVAVAGDGRLLAANQKFLDFFGLQPIPIEGGRLQDLNSDIAGRWQSDGDTILLSDPAAGRRDIDRPGGTVIEEHASPMADGVVATYADVTAAREARFAYRGGEIAHWEYDLITGVMQFGDRFWAILGYAQTPERAQGDGTADDGDGRLAEFWSGIAHQGDMNSFRRQTRQVLAGDAERMSQLMRLRKADGGWLWTLIRGRQVDRGDKGHRVVGMICDVDELVRLETALRSAKENAERQTEEKTRLLATLSHEIKNPLNGIMGLVRLLDGQTLTDEQHQMLGRILRTGQDMVGIVTAILNLARFEITRERAPARAESLTDLLEQVRELFTAMAAEKGLTLQVEYHSDGTDTFLFDRSTLLQVLSNLVGNAVRYTDAGSVALSAKVGEPVEGAADILISVRDTGPGISQKMQATLFDEFTREADGGSGLGLYIARKLMQTMDGELSYAPSPGGGACFTVEMTLRQTEDGQLAPAAESLEIRPLSLLLVEDYALNRDVAAGMLRRVGHTVTTAASGEQALEVLADQRFDLVLMDIRLPGRDGVETLQEMRAREIDTPCLAVTANAGAYDQIRYREAGFVDVVPKPIDPDRLLFALSRAIVGSTGLMEGDGALPDDSVAGGQWGTDRVAALIAAVGLPRTLEHFSEFLRELPGLRQRLSDLDHPQAIADEVHKLAGIAANFGLHALHQAAAAVETALNDGGEANFSALNDCLDGAESHLRDVMAQLSESAPPDGSVSA